MPLSCCAGQSTPPAKSHDYDLPARAETTPASPSRQHVYSQPPDDVIGGFGDLSSQDAEEDAFMDTTALPRTGARTGTTTFGTAARRLSATSDASDAAPRAGSVLPGTYVAKFDMEGTDDGEASFKAGGRQGSSAADVLQRGDAIVNVRLIDDNWFHGTVQSTGVTGLIPASFIMRAGPGVRASTVSGIETDF